MVDSYDSVISRSILNVVYNDLNYFVTAWSIDPCEWLID